MKTLRKILSLATLFTIIFALSGCAYIPETIEMDYCPATSCAPIDQANEITLDVHVLDNRRNGKQVGCKTGENQIELASIRLSGELSEDVASAIRQELGNRGFITSGGRVTVEVEINKFNNDFKQGFLKPRSAAELILGVNVQNDQGLIFYSKTIIGIGENTNMWIQSGQNAKVALQDALHDAIDKLVNDKAFIQALFKANQTGKI